MSTVTHDYLQREGGDGPELYAMFLTAAMGAQIMVSATWWHPDLMLYIVTGLSVPFLLRHADHDVFAGVAERGDAHFAEAQAAQPVFTGSSARPTGSGVTAWLTIGDMP